MKKMIEMRRKLKRSLRCCILATTVIAMLFGCSRQDDSAKQQRELLIYCGITMVHPIKKIATIIEERENCKITIFQGGSEDLYQSLKMSKKGDLYFPGSHTYREKHLDEGLLGEYVEVGYNQANLVVEKGNPKRIKADIHVLLDPRYNVIIGNPESCSIGKQAEKILKKQNIFQKVVDNSITLAADSRNMNNLLIDGSADVILNWKATAYFDENRSKLDPLELDESVAPKNKLLLNLLTFSEQKELARAFMEYAVSADGLTVFKNYGFRD